MLSLKSDRCLWAEYRRDLNMKHLCIVYYGDSKSNAISLNLTLTNKPRGRTSFYSTDCHIMKTVTWLRKALKKSSPALPPQAKREQLDLCACSLQKSLHIGIITLWALHNEEKTSKYAGACYSEQMISSCHCLTSC